MHISTTTTRVCTRLPTQHGARRPLPPRADAASRVRACSIAIARQMRGGRGAGLPPPKRDTLTCLLQDHNPWVNTRQHRACRHSRGVSFWPDKLPPSLSPPVRTETEAQRRFAAQQVEKQKKAYKQQRFEELMQKERAADPTGAFKQPASLVPPALAEHVRERTAQMRKQSREEAQACQEQAFQQVPYLGPAPDGPAPTNSQPVVVVPPSTTVRPFWGFPHLLGGEEGRRNPVRARCAGAFTVRTHLEGGEGSRTCNRTTSPGDSSRRRR